MKLPLLARARFRFATHAASALVLLASMRWVQAQRMDLADASATPIRIQSAHLHTEVTGRLAGTTYDLVFHNPNRRPLEGTFSLPLLDGQRVVRFALDINGKLREAVPVDKPRAQAVFEEIERRNVDPGLIEKTEGNIYRTRVFPLPANGTRRIVIAYQEDLPRSAGTTAYRLNLDFPALVSDFKLTLSVLGEAETAPAASTTLDLALPPWDRSNRLAVEKRDYRPRGLLKLELPPQKNPAVLTQQRGDDTYFYAELPLRVDPRPRSAPKVVGLLWDSSLSGRLRSREAEFQLLDALFAQLRNVDVRLVCLRNTASVAATFEVRDGEWNLLRQSIEKTPYDGATSLDGLQDDPSVQEWFLFSDGLFNFGTARGLTRLPLSGTVHAVLASTRAAPDLLRAIARRHGGEFVDLLSRDPHSAAHALRSQSPRIFEIDRDPNEVAEVFPEPGATVTGGVTVVTGILRGARTTLMLKVGHDEKTARFTALHVRADENPSSLAGRAWALAKLSALSLDELANRADMRRTSRDFGVVTNDTSLLVLETVEDYVRYEIAPPDELKKEWFARRTAIQQRRSKDWDAHRENLVRRFEERVDWWEGKSRPVKTHSAPTSFGSRPAGITGGDADRAPASGSDDVVVLSEFTVLAEREGKARAMAENRASASVGAGGGRHYAPVPARGPAEPEAAPAIVFKAWSPEAGYLDRLRRAPAQGAYAIYLEERVRHLSEPGFFVDVADFFFQRKDEATALQVLSNLAEIGLEEAPLLRLLGHRLVQAERADLALSIFERVLALRPEEPQSRRDIATVCALLGQHQRAVDLLWEVASRPWDGRFPEIELIAVTELNAIAASCGRSLDLSQVDARLRRNLPTDIRIVLSWDVDNCDIDLWVTDPTGEIAKYSHPHTRMGGRLSRDFTGGYGPEEFLLRSAQPGAYRAQINYYGSRSQTLLGPVTAQIRMITGFGTPQQKEKRQTVRLNQTSETLDIGSLLVAK